MHQRLVIQCLLIVVASVGGGLVPLVRVINHVRMQIYLSFAAGVMLGSALLHMLPESAELGGPEVVAWSLPGLVTLFVIERFFSFHHHEFDADEDEVTKALANDSVEDGYRIEQSDCGHGHDHDDHHHSHRKSAIHPIEKTAGLAERDERSAVQNARFQWKAAAVGLAVHSLLGGVALASASAASPDALWTVSNGVFLATLLHKPADALTITSLMKRGKAKAGLAHAVNFLFAMMIPLGAMLFAFGQSRLTMLPQETITGFTGAALAFSAGTFLCIALSDLLPELQFHSHDRIKLTSALISGIMLMALVAWFGE